MYYEDVPNGQTLCIGSCKNMHINTFLNIQRNILITHKMWNLSSQKNSNGYSTTQR